MLAFNFNDWTYWDNYNPPVSFGTQKCTFDGPHKRIIVNADVTSLSIKEDVYSGWKEWMKDPHHTNAGYLPAVASTGGEPIPGTINFTGDAYFLINGWRLIIDITEVAVSGVLFSSTESTAYYDKNLKAIFPATVSALVNTVGVATAETAADISAAVWDKATAEHQIVGSTGEALTAPASVEVGPETAAAISDAVWNKLLVDMVTAGTAGERMNAMLTVNKYLALQK
jgi:hypothetical protein